MTPILTIEHPRVAHRPALAPHQQYVQWTEHHQHQAQGLPPCATHLWQYLLYKYPGGVPQEIDLEEVRFAISQGRSKTYCVQSLKNALWRYLVPRGLVAVFKRFTKRVMRVVANHAGPVKEITKKFDKLEFDLLPTKGLKSPIAAFKYFIKNNCQPRLWDRQAWWNRAAAALGKQRRDRLIQSVTEYAGEVVVIFTNGRRLTLAQAQALSWEAIAALGEKS